MQLHCDQGLQHMHWNELYSLPQLGASETSCFKTNYCFLQDLHYTALVGQIAFVLFVGLIFGMKKEMICSRETSNPTFTLRFKEGMIKLPDFKETPLFL
ncbi:hypothetical protein REPUB_Repub14bG0052400 [Reevesia pubescens]